MAIEHLNPDTLHANPAFTQVIAVDDADRLVFVGGQNAVDAKGAIVGDDLKTQTAQALRNVLGALAAAKMDQTNVVRLGVYVVAGHDVRDAFAAAQATWGRHPTAMTVLVVAALANPAFLVEIEANAVRVRGGR